jgi:hypothetical protein
MRSLRRASIEPYDPIDIYHPAIDEDVSTSHIPNPSFLEKTLFSISRIPRLTVHLKEKKKFVLYPNSPVRRAMDLIASFFVVWTCIIVPFQIGFEWWEAPSWVETLSTVIDYFFVVDIIANFRTAYIEHGELFASGAKIRDHYLRTWFLPDVISVIPYESFLRASASTRKSFKLAKLQKLPK